MILGTPGNGKFYEIQKEFTIDYRFYVSTFILQAHQSILNKVRLDGYLANDMHECSSEY